jgi:tRNA-specific 2-thiouridylase
MLQKKVLIGISGGVDSSVACALLKNKGYAVSAVFLRFWEAGEKAKKALADAKNICSVLDIPLAILEVRKEFKNTVVRYFLAEYARGKTPNPCVFCNEKMKFKLLFETADKLGIKMVATGHYAQIMPCLPAGRKHKTCLPDRQAYSMKQRMLYGLFPAKDSKKDQSYFLYRLGQKELVRIIFPLGGYQKAEVRKLAEKFNLPVFEKSDSQDVCFMADNNLEKFLAKKIKLKKGKIIDTQGNVLGEHRGLALYTIGQRKGIEIGGTGPYFVVAKDTKKNSLIVTNNPKHLMLAKKIIELKDVVWTSGVVPKIPLKITVRTRYHNPLVCATIIDIKDDKNWRLEFAVPQKAISPGQSVVFYGRDEEVLGGGIIT